MGSRIFYDRLLRYNLLLSAKSVICYPSSNNSFKCHVCSCSSTLYALISIFIPLLSFWQHFGRVKKRTPVANQLFKTEIHHMSSKNIEPQKRNRVLILFSQKAPCHLHKLVYLLLKEIISLDQKL